MDSYNDTPIECPHCHETYINPERVEKRESFPGLWSAYDRVTYEFVCPHCKQGADS